MAQTNEDNLLFDSAALDAKIRRGIEEYEQGKVYRILEEESSEDFLGRMLNED